MEPKYKKYRVTASGTIYISNATAKDLRESTFLVVDGVTLRANKTVRLVRKENPDIPSKGHL